MKTIKFGIIAFSVLLLAACGSGDSYSDYEEADYIYWSGSVNGTIVVDATDDAFEFEVYSGYLHFGSTTYNNAWVDDYANFWVDGEIIGGVYLVEDVDGYSIAALVSNNGYFIDIYGPESDLHWTETGLLPIYALNTAGTPTRTLDQSVVQQLTKVPQALSGKGVAPIMQPNAIKGAQSEPASGQLLKSK